MAEKAVRKKATKKVARKKTTTRKAPSRVAQTPKRSQPKGLWIALGVFVVVLAGSAGLGFSDTGVISVSDVIAQRKQNATGDEKQKLKHLPVQNHSGGDGLVPTSAQDPDVQRRKEEATAAQNASSSATSTNQTASSTATSTGTIASSTPQEQKPKDDGLVPSGDTVAQ